MVECGSGQNLYGRRWSAWNWCCTWTARRRDEHTLSLAVDLRCQCHGGWLRRDSDGDLQSIWPYSTFLPHDTNSPPF